MPVYKNSKNGSWYVMVRYTDWRGERKQKCQRGFTTKKEAQEWERQFLLQIKADMDMTLESFCKLYEKDVRPRLKLNTWLTKEHIIKAKILPYLGKRKLSEITAKDVIDWQNEIGTLKTPSGKTLSPTYLKTIHAQLSSIFNHANRYYDLSINPAKKAGMMGVEESKEMLFWTKEEYLQFAEAMMAKPLSYYAFEMLYWCGIREGELLALTPADFDFETETVQISKSYQRLKGKDVITSPKTRKGNRTIKMPKFLCEEMQDCLKMFYDIKDTDRIFPISKHYLFNEMQRGCKETGVKRIRVHDLRHSHVFLLIDKGFSALAIGERVGHEAERITYRYAHLFPTVQTEMANMLKEERNVEVRVMSEKVMDRQGRWRNKTVAFRVSPEEDEIIKSAVRLSGLTKQEYIIRRLQEKDVIVQGNPRVYKALKDEMQKILMELQRIRDASDMNQDLLEVISLVADIMSGMKEGCE